MTTPITPDTCPACGAFDPMGDEDAWHGTDCPVVDLGHVAEQMAGSPIDWMDAPHVITLGGNVVGIAATLTDPYSTGVLVTIADREPVKMHPGDPAHPGYTVTVCRDGDDNPDHDHADDPTATVDRYVAVASTVSALAFFTDPARA